MTTMAVSACKRLRMRGLALLGLAALATGYAEPAAAKGHFGLLGAMVHGSMTLHKNPKNGRNYGLKPCRWASIIKD